jgi:hypothetical protein
MPNNPSPARTAEDNTVRSEVQKFTDSMERGFDAIKADLDRILGRADSGEES